MEVGAKYILGRTGNLLPYDEFSKHRPDVSRGDYNAYKAFKYKKDGDFDLSDGDFTVPTGVIKGTMDGIHGPEIQFLGRNLPVTTTMIPYGCTGWWCCGCTYQTSHQRWTSRRHSWLCRCCNWYDYRRDTKTSIFNQSQFQGGSAEQYL